MAFLLSNFPQELVQDVVGDCMHVLSCIVRRAVVHWAHHFDLVVGRNDVLGSIDTASVPREIQQYGGFPVVWDVGIVAEV